MHDYLKEYGGAERVLESLHEIFPNAPVYTAYFDPNGLGIHTRRFKDWDIRTSWLQKIPSKILLESRFSRTFAPLIFENIDMSEYDLVISSCNVYSSKAVITKPGSLHISYIHTPPKDLYGYSTGSYKQDTVTRVLGDVIKHFLRIDDFETSQRPDILVANSKHVAERIRRFYGREAVVIYPPVDIDRLQRVDYMGQRKYFITVGRLVKDKGIDIIVEACEQLGISLKVVGTGPEMGRLKLKAQSAGSKTVEFLGQVNDEELPELYAGAIATIVASEDEDFGIVPVESMACGTPVIAPKYGGYLETVVDNKTGVLYGGLHRVNVERLIEGINRFNDLNHFKAEDCRKQAEQFSKERFRREILELIDKNL